ncbi:hypothetical protein Tco_0578483, partial [Tanacetum coccineum]
MHIYTSVLTADEVDSLVKEYAIPLVLRPSVPPFTLTLNKLLKDKINSSVVDSPPTGVQAEDVRRLCENVIDLRPVHPVMLYAVGFTTIWKHVGHHLVFKDGEGTVATSMSQFLKFPISQILEKSDHQKVVEHEDEMVLAEIRKSQEAKDKVAGKRSAAEGTSLLGTHHSTWPLTTIIPNDTNPTASGSNLALDSSNRPEGDTGNSLDNHSAHSDEDTHAHSGGDGLYHDEHVRRHASGSTGHVLSSSSGDSGRQVFPQRNPGGDGIGSSIRANVSPPAPFSIWAALVRKRLLLKSLLRWRRKKDELLDKNRGQEEQIMQLEEALASKTSFVSEEENAANVLK